MQDATGHVCSAPVPTAPNDEYVPRLTQIEDGYSWDSEEGRVGARRRAFRRWLAAHDRQVRDAALTEAEAAVEALESEIYRKSFSGVEYVAEGLEDALAAIRSLQEGNK